MRTEEDLNPAEKHLFQLYCFWIYPAECIKREADLQGDGTWGHLSPEVHSHHALHVGLHDWNHWEALLRLLLLNGHHSCGKAQKQLKYKRK